MTEELDDLPIGWMSVAIGDVTETKVDQQGPSGEGEFTYIDISSVDNATKAISDPKRVPNEDAPSRARQRIRRGDVLVSMTRPNLNAVAKVPQELDGAIASTGFDVLRSKEVEPNWLFAHVRSRAFVDSMSDLVRGALYPAVNAKEIREYQIPLPPLPEQRRIVAKIEALQARSRKAREALEAIPPLLEQFRQSVLAAAFRGDLTADWREQHPDVEPASVLLERIRVQRREKWEQAELAKFKAKGKVPKDDTWKQKYVEPQPIDDTDLPELPEGWCWTTLDEVTSRITDGEHQTPPRTDNGVMLLSARNILDGKLSFTTVDFIAEETHRKLCERIEVFEGDVLLSCSGTVGRSCVVPPEPKYSFVRSVAILRPVVLMGKFVSLALRSPFVQSQIHSKKTQTAQANLFQGRIRTLVIPLPPHDEQTEIVRACCLCLAEMESQIEYCRSANSALSQLNHSILAKAFRGELVPQDPSDEPASKLLERIRAQRAAEIKGKPTHASRNQLYL